MGFSGLKDFLVRLLGIVLLSLLNQHKHALAKQIDFGFMYAERLNCISVSTGNW